MSIELITILLFAVFITLLVAGLPLAFSMGCHRVRVYPHPVFSGNYDDVGDAHLPI